VASSIDWSAFAAAILNPPTPRLEAALRLARSLARERIRRAPGARAGRWRPVPSAEEAAALADPEFLADAWETMTHRLGADDLFDRSARGQTAFVPFVPLREWAVPRPAPECQAPFPLDLETMVAVLAAEPGHVLAAEETALEIGRRLESWRGRNVRTVTWGFVGDRWPGRQLESAFYLPGTSVNFIGPEGRASDREIYRAMGVPYGEEIFSVSRREYDGPGFRVSQAAATDAQTWSRWKWADRVGIEAALPDAISARDRARAAGRSGTPVYDATLSLWGLGYVPVDVLGDAFYVGVSLPRYVGAVAATSLRAVAREAQRRYGEEL